MTTIIERESSGPAALLVTILIIFLIAGGVWFGYANGAFGEKTTVIENNKTVENKTVVVPVQTPAPAPAKAPESEKPAEAPAR